MNELPFYTCNKLDFENLFDKNLNVEQFNEILQDNKFRSVLYKLKKDKPLNNLDCNYYTCEEFNNKFAKLKSLAELSIFHVNIRSLNSKIREFCTLIHLLEIEFDVIILSEIWSYNLNFYQDILKGYVLFFELPLSSSIGGVGMFVKTSLYPKLRCDLNLPSSSVKCECLFLEIIKNNSKYIVGGIYRHPNQNIEQFCNIFQSTLNKICKSKIPCLLAGDINIDFLKVEENKHTSDYLNNLLLNNCLPVLLLPTRLTHKSSTLIDHLYYYEGCNSKKELNISSGNIFYDISDHLPNFVILSNCKNKINISHRPMIRLFTAKNKTIFHQKLVTVDWQNILYSGSDVNICYNRFLSVVQNIMNDAFPYVCQSRRAFKDKIWITSGLKTSCKTKDKLFRAWQLTKCKI